MGRFTVYETTPKPERALLVGICWRTTTWPVDRSLDELARLASTAGADEVCRLTQRLEKPVPRTLIGSGKVEELIRLVHALDIDVVIFDDELTPSQQTNLEKLVGEPTKIIDRTALILDIFGMRAQTREGRLQVQLAQLQYLMPRLRGMWSHLAKEQTRGGIGSRFGQGESQLEVDRRLVRNRISQLKKELALVERRRRTQSKERIESMAFRVALAGYTNAGKSSLLNRLTDSSVVAQDKLFATLDPTTRSCALPGGRSMTITDTVGFIQKLPHGLVDAFKSTLSEVKEADLILKVIDVSDEDAVHQHEVVDRVLDEIQAGDRQALVVFNKIDRLAEGELEILRMRQPEAVFVSATTGAGIADLIDRLSHIAATHDESVTLVLPYSQSELLHIIRVQGEVQNERFEEDGTHLKARVPRSLVPRVQRYRIDEQSPSA